MFTAILKLNHRAITFTTKQQPWGVGPDRFYAFCYDSETGIPVGYVAAHEMTDVQEC